MADTKISALPPASTPLTGTEVLPIVQSGTTDKVAVSDLTAGRAVAAAGLTIDANSSTDAVRITQTGAGNALLVEDSANPDASPFVVNANGNVGIGLTTPNFAKLQISNAGAEGLEFAPAVSAGINRILSYNRTTNAYNTFRLDGAEIQFYTGGADRVRIDNAGRIGINGAASGGQTISIAGNMTGNTSAVCIRAAQTVQSDVTANAFGFNSILTTAAASFTLGNLYHFRASPSAFGAGSTVTAQAGFFAESTLTGATTNYGFLSNISAATGRWNFYAGANANNAFLGNTRFGAVTVPVATVDVTGNVAATTTILSSGATSGIGYATGAGGAVTQATSRTTGVTLNTVSGAITLFSAAGSTTWSTFTVTNSAIAATDTIIINQKSGTDLYEIHITAVAAGSFNVSFRTTGGTTTEQPVFNFAVIKAVAA